ncbi:hypothetical protein HS1genome_1714 [Sulfodiicoccus acidiphilus]|uniref:NurA domain-containing protein n=2 Tax=Sulfodiicoccus acidiphilus TaxID=1670455 RepID=A0A348B573_9CREN|nr:hypothetical protein HS1genome_1714 [Sulfodiicoccus acidiphilus]GGT89094.1 hypothetical protein GCM10007116_03650 [Sulfodiicoccus acidiphilus]
MELLSQVAREKPYLGPGEPGLREVAGPVTLLGELGKCGPLDEFAYLDSSSRTLSVRGARILVASLYANDGGNHFTIPPARFPFVGLKASREVASAVSSDPTLSELVRLRSPAGELYDQDYKEDNVLDELRISLENYAVTSSNRITFVDGPVVPGPFPSTMGPKYEAAFQQLLKERLPRLPDLVGIVKRLEFSRKLARALGSDSSDEVLTLDLGRGKAIYVSPVLKEDVKVGEEEVSRYMTYVRVRDSAFRVESSNPDLLCPGVRTALLHSSFRGIPTFIEVADRLSRRLGSASFVQAFLYAHQLVGVSYESWNWYQEALKELSQ